MHCSSATTSIIIVNSFNSLRADCWPCPKFVALPRHLCQSRTAEEPLGTNILLKKDQCIVSRLFTPEFKQPPQSDCAVLRSALPISTLQHRLTAQKSLKSTCFRTTSPWDVSIHVHVHLQNRTTPLPYKASLRSRCTPHKSAAEARQVRP
jgi:hypothetical protein